MKKAICILLVAIAMICLQVAANSATLQAGWHVDIYSVTHWKWLWDPNIHYYDHYIIGSGYFSTPAGQYGPFAVTNPFNDYLARSVSVPTTVEASSADSLKLPFTVSPGWTDAYIDFAASTNYDFSVMGLSLWSVQADGTSTKIWSQSPGQTGLQTVFQPVTQQSYYFLVSIVPEPSSLVVLLLGVSTAGVLMKRRLAKCG